MVNKTDQSVKFMTNMIELPSRNCYSYACRSKKKTVDEGLQRTWVRDCWR